MRKRILMVDDDEICHFIHSKMIAKLCVDCDIQTALNGVDALAKLQAYADQSDHVPQLILLDLNMPIMDGFEFIKRFEQLQLPGKEQVTIIIVTSSLRNEDVSRAASFGINNFYSKPLTEQDASAIILGA